MTETQTLTILGVEMSPAPATWAVYDVKRTATHAEAAVLDGRCRDCHEPIVAKVGGGAIRGVLHGHRANPDLSWEWYGPLCPPCQIVHCIADGFDR